MTHQVTVGDYLIKLTLFESGECEFTAINGCTEYRSCSKLKFLSHIENFDSYFGDFHKMIEIDRIEDVSLEIKLPVPYANKFEIIELDAITDSKKLRAAIEKNSEELKTYVLEVQKKMEQELYKKIAALEAANPETYFIHVQLQQKNNQVFLVSNCEHEKMIVDYLLNDRKEWIWGYFIKHIEDMKNPTLQMLINYSFMQNFYRFVELLHKLNFVLTNDSHIINKHYYLAYQKETYDRVAITHIMDKKMLLKKYKIVHVHGTGDVYRIIYFNE